MRFAKCVWMKKQNKLFCVNVLISNPPHTYAHKHKHIRTQTHRLQNRYTRYTIKVFASSSTRHTLWQLYMRYYFEIQSPVYPYAAVHSLLLPTLFEIEMIFFPLFARARFFCVRILIRGRFFSCADLFISWHDFNDCKSAALFCENRFDIWMLLHRLSTSLIYMDQIHYFRYFTTSLLYFSFQFLFLVFLACVILVAIWIHSVDAASHSNRVYRIIWYTHNDVDT